MKKGHKGPGNGDYEVGFGRTPKHTRFRKGKSGNPAGRPKGAKNKQRLAGKQLTALLRRELMREVEVRGAHGPETLSMLEAAMRSLTVKAAKGDVPAQKAVLALSRAVDAEETAERERQYEFWKDYKARKWEEIRQYHLAGQPEPQILPHPDDVVIDQHTGEIIIRGPANAQQKEEWDRLWAGKEAQEEELLKYEEQLSGLPQDAGEERECLQDDIKETKFFLTLYCMKLMTVFHLPASDVTDGRFFQDQLTQRVAEGHWPEPPVNAGVKLGHGAAQNWATLDLRGTRAVGGGQSSALSM